MKRKPFNLEAFKAGAIAYNDLGIARVYCETDQFGRIWAKNVGTGTAASFYPEDLENEFFFL